MPEKLASVMVSPVYLLTSPGSLGLRQPYSAQQVGVAWVGTQPIPVHVYCKPRHGSGSWIEVERLMVLNNRLIVSSRVRIDYFRLRNYLRCQRVKLLCV